MQIDYRLGDDHDGSSSSSNSTATPGGGPNKKTMKRVQELFQTRLDYGHEDYFGKPWDEVVYENSPYFPGGRCALQAIFTFLTIE